MTAEEQKTAQAIDLEDIVKQIRQLPGDAWFCSYERKNTNPTSSLAGASSSAITYSAPVDSPKDARVFVRWSSELDGLSNKRYAKYIVEINLPHVTEFSITPPICIKDLFEIVHANVLDSEYRSEQEKNVLKTLYKKTEHIVEEKK